MAPYLSKEQVHRLCNRASQAYARNSGRGPVDIQAQVKEDSIIVVLSGILSPLERHLLDRNRSDLVREIRAVVAEDMQQMWRAYLTQEFRVQVTAITNQVDLEEDRSTYVIGIAAR